MQSQPPPIPGQNPTPAPGSGPGPRTVLLTVGIVGIVVVLLVAVGAALLLPALAKAKAQARQRAQADVDADAVVRDVIAGAQAAPAAQTALTDEEIGLAAAFSEELGSALEESDTDWIRNNTDFAMVAARAFEGLNEDPTAIAQFRRIISQTKGGLLRQLVGGRIHLHGIHRRDGFTALFVRANPPEEGLVFVDILLERRGDRFRVVDIYNYTLGAMATREAGIAMAMLSPESPDFLGRMFGLGGTTDREAAKNFVAMFRHLREGEFGEVIAAHDRLPDTFHTNRLAFTLLIKALQQDLDDSARVERFLREIRRAPDILGTNSAISMLVIDFHAGRGEFRQAADAVLETLKAVVRDAQLLQMQGAYEAQAGNLAVAERCLAEAEALEPDLADLIDLRLMLLAAKGDHPGAVKALREFEKENDVRLDPDVFSGEIYKSLLASPEFIEWAAEPRN